MKKLLILIMLVISGICLSAEYEELKFRSVNTCAPIVTNYNPEIYPVGARTIYDTHPQIRKVGVNDNPEEPYLTPIGDIPLLFIILMCALYKLKPRIIPGFLCLGQ